MNIFKAIRKALADRDKYLQETEENLKSIRATLDGEDRWFLDARETKREVRLECECREVKKDNHAA